MLLKSRILRGVITLLGVFFLCYGCAENQTKKQTTGETPSLNTKVSQHTDSPLEQIEIDSLKFAYGFDFPVGKPDGTGYYNAQIFEENNHLGDDWNGKNGGNSDLGDPIYTIGRGYVKFAQDVGGGWGNVIRIIHYLPNGEQYESLYAHCDAITIGAEKWVEKGTQIGTIGTANGQYYAHLHLEVRTDANMEIGGGYAEDRTGYIDPTAFIKAHRIIEK